LHIVPEDTGVVGAVSAAKDREANRDRRIRNEAVIRYLEEAMIEIWSS
jgi:hypothetical protein